MGKRSYNPARFAIMAGMYCAALLCASLFSADGAQAQIAKVPNDDGRILFVNAEPPPLLKLTPRRAGDLRASAARLDLRAPAEHSNLVGTTERADLGAIIRWIADDDRHGVGDEAIDEVVEDFSFDEHARAGAAILAGVGEDGHGRRAGADGDRRR